MLSTVKLQQNEEKRWSSHSSCQHRDEVVTGMEREQSTFFAKSPLYRNCRRRKTR